MKPRLAGFAALLAAACTISERPVPDRAATEPRLHYLATAEQFGVVSFRDPQGAISPDGHWLAWSVQHHLHLMPVPLGPVTSAPADSGLIVHLVWTRDSKSVAIDRRDVAPRWRRYDLATGRETPLFPPEIELKAQGKSGPLAVRPDQLRQLAFSSDGARLAGVRDRSEGSELWSFGPGGEAPEVLESAERLSFPTWGADGSVVCLSNDGTTQRLSIPCGTGGAGEEAYGPPAFSPDGKTLYYSAPDRDGVVALYSSKAVGRSDGRLTSFARDAYAPSVAADGSVLFKVQSYRTTVGVVDAEGGAVRPLSTFRSETPSWRPDGSAIGVTYGTWRRVMDDFKYPDIAQEIGTIGTDPEHPARAPAQVIEASPSEDQSLAWSPNGKWIAFHSHREMGDDIWLKPADGSAAARRITSFGRGAETGWPRWSADGRWIAFDAAPRDSSGPSRSMIHVMQVNQESGEVSGPARAVALAGYAGEAVHTEWLPDSRRLVILGEDGGGWWSLLLVDQAGGAPRVIHRWQSEHRFAGHGVSPDGKYVAFIAPAGEHFQLFRIPVVGGKPEQLTFDPSNKSQPAWSPDGKRIALTVWQYQAQFWVLGGAIFPL